MRRLLVLALCLASGPAFAGVARLPVGTQLSLFAPVSVAPREFFPMPLPQSIAPVGGLIPAATPAPVFAVMPKAVSAAFYAGDAAAFVAAARKAEYEIPEGDEHQDALYRLGLEKEAAERTLLDMGEAAAMSRPLPAPKRATKIDYEEFGRQLKAHPGLSSSPFQHAPAKRKILKASGYDRLRGPEGPVTIERATDARVGMAFAHVLRAFERR